MHSLPVTPMESSRFRAPAFAYGAATCEDGQLFTCICKRSRTHGEIYGRVARKLVSHATASTGFDVVRLGSGGPCITIF